MASRGATGSGVAAEAFFIRRYPREFGEGKLLWRRLTTASFRRLGSRSFGLMVQGLNENMMSVSAEAMDSGSDVALPSMAATGGPGGRDSSAANSDAISPGDFDRSWNLWPGSGGSLGDIPSERQQGEWVVGTPGWRRFCHGGWRKEKCLC